MRCQSCGHDNPPGASFCANCGASLAAAIEQPAPAVAPAPAVEYMGFWIRVAAAIIDSLVITVAAFFLFQIAHMGTFIIMFFGFLLYHWLCTGLKGQTLGKMALGLKVVDAAGSVPGLGSAALREIPGKLLSTIVIYLGFLWVAWDKQKQGWHDMIADTYVVKSRLE